MKGIDLVKLKVLAARLLNPTDRFSEVSDKFEWKAVASPAVISELIEQLEAAQRKGNEAVLLRIKESSALSVATARYEKAEAELKRRDAQEPVAWINTRPGDPTWPRVYVSREKADENRKWVELAPMVNTAPLYAAAPAAVPEKVVKLPAKVHGESVEYGGSGAFNMGKQCGINEGIVRCAAALDAAGVKWVEGE